MILSQPIQLMTSIRCSGSSASSIGWVETQKCCRRYSDGARFKCGTSSFMRFQFWSSRQPSEGIQPKPASINTNLSSGQFSNTPSMIRLVTEAPSEAECSVISSI
jgi:hypothetical protein